MKPPEGRQPRDQVGFDRLHPPEDHPAAKAFQSVEDTDHDEPNKSDPDPDAVDADPVAEPTPDTGFGEEDEFGYVRDDSRYGEEGEGPEGRDGDDSGEDGGDDDGGNGDGGGGNGDDPDGSDNPPDDVEPPAAMGLLDHLGELRSVLIHSGLAALLAAVLCWFWSADLLDLLVLPIKDQGVYFTAPNEAFLTRLKLAGIVGLFVVAPFIFFRIYGFVLPGLYSREKRIVTPLLIATTILFYLGVAFAFMVVIPQVVRFLMSFGTEAMEPLIGVGPYFAFVARLCLAFGLVFELPLLVLLLSVMGLVNPRMLLRTWRFAILVIAAMSALLTPPDVISQLMMAGPVLILYLGSVLVAMLVVRRKRNED